jgi:hypothetical protein
MDVTFDDITAALDSLAEAFNSAPAQGGSIYDPPPDGDYQALVHEFNFVGWDAKPAMNGQPAKPAGIGLKVNYQITNDATYAGRVCGTMFNLHPERIGYLKGWLSKLGVETDGLDIRQLRPEPGGLLEKLLDTPVLIRVVRKGGYTNIYLEDRLGDARTSDVTSQQSFQEFAPAAKTRAADDDIPF